MEIDDVRKSFIKIDNFYQLNQNQENFYLLNDFFYEFENKVKLPENFWQSIVELENDLARNFESLDDIKVEELAYLYKVNFTNLNR